VVVHESANVAHARGVDDVKIIQPEKVAALHTNPLIKFLPHVRDGLKRARRTVEERPDYVKKGGGAQVA